MRSIRIACVVVLVFSGAVAAAPATQPAAFADPEAEGAKLIRQVEQAYGKLKSLKLSGTWTSERKDWVFVERFTVQYEAPSKVRFDLCEVHGVTGKPRPGQQTRPATTFVQTKYVIIRDASRQAEYFRGVPGELIIRDPKPLGAFNWPFDLPLNGMLKRMIVSQRWTAQRGADVEIDGKTCPVLELQPQPRRKLSLIVDPQTGFIRRTIAWPIVESSGAATDKKTADYEIIEPDAKIDGSVFDYKPPDGTKIRDWRGRT